MHLFLTLVLGLATVAAGLATVTRRNPLYAALSMLLALGGVAVLMLGLHSPFLAVMQVLLYGGAIMVLFVFVIMLLTLKEEEMGPEAPPATRAMAALGSFALLGTLWWAISRREPRVFHGPVLGDAFGSTEHFARFLYTDYVVSFELVTVLVLAAMAGVVALARRSDRASLEGARVSGAESPLRSVYPGQVEGVPADARGPLVPHHRPAAGPQSAPPGTDSPPAADAGRTH